MFSTILCVNFAIHKPLQTCKCVFNILIPLTLTTELKFSLFQHVTQVVPPVVEQAAVILVLLASMAQPAHQVSEEPSPLIQCMETNIYDM